MFTGTFNNDKYLHILFNRLGPSMPVAASHPKKMKSQQMPRCPRSVLSAHAKTATKHSTRRTALTTTKRGLRERGVSVNATSNARNARPYMLWTLRQRMGAKDTNVMNATASVAAVGFKQKS
jgi:hypothetical protein